MYTRYAVNESSIEQNLEEPTNQLTKILIIDDNRDFANILCSLLNHLEYQSFTAYDEKRAIDKIVKIKPDLVFCDLGLPNRGAYRIANKIRSECSLYHIFLVALTYYTREKIKLTTLDLGYDSYVSKPLQTATLQEIFEKVEIRKAIYNRPKSLTYAG